MGETMTGEL